MSSDPTRVLLEVRGPLTQMVLVPLGGVGEGGQIGGGPGAHPVHLRLLELLQELGSFVKVLVAIVVFRFLLHRLA